MAFQNAPNMASVVFRATLGGQQVANVLNFKHASGVTTGNLQSLCETTATYWEASVLPHMNVAYVMGEVTATDLSVQSSFQYTDATHAGTPGGNNASQALPANVAFVVTYRTGQIGRAYRGRTYITGLSEGIVEGNLVTTAFADDIVEAIAAVTASPALSGWQFVVLSRQFNGVLRDEAVGTSVTTIQWRDRRVDTQRRRLG